MIYKIIKEAYCGQYSWHSKTGERVGGTQSTSDINDAYRQLEYQQLSFNKTGCGCRVKVLEEA